MSGAPELGSPPERVVVDLAQARRLVSSQLKHWADLPVELVAMGGWDNYTFRLGTDMVLRLPSAAEYAEAVEKEHRWLPVLGASLPRPIPIPLAQGAPSADYPFPWSVYRWLDGHTASAERIANPITFATDVAAFLAALQELDAVDGPRPGLHNWFRGGTLRTYDNNTQRALVDLQSHIDVGWAGRVWADALSTPWDGVDRWFHGDIAEGNLLLDDSGQLSAVIDFGTCGVGDPACDLAVAWTLLTADGRQAFRDRLEVDDQTWQRGRGWALWKTIATCWATFEDPEDVQIFEVAKRTLATILRD